MRSPARWLSMTALFAFLVSIPFFLPEPTAARSAAGKETDFEGSGTSGTAAKSSSAGNRPARAKERADRNAIEKAREELRKDPVLGRIWGDGSYESNLAAFFRHRFDPKALRSLLDQPDPELNKIAAQILQAAAERNPECKDLLQHSNLREKDPVLDLALSAYDYMVNDNAAALDHILDAHRAAGGEIGSWESIAVWVLGYVDEWPRTEAALKSRVLSADGAGADARYAFWLKRRYFFPLNQDFPQDYERFWKHLDRAHGRKED